MTRPATPRVLRERKSSFFPLKHRPQHFPTVILSLYPNTQNSCDISSGGCGCMNHVWKSKCASAKETDVGLSLNLPLHMVNLK